MKLFRFGMGILLIVFFGCQPSNNKTEVLDSLKTDSTYVEDSNTSYTSTPVSFYYELPILTYQETYLSEDSTAVPSTEVVPALTQVKIMEQTAATVGEDCGYYVHKVMLPDFKEGWIAGIDLAFPGSSYSFVQATQVSLFDSDYTVFSLTRGGEITGQECGSAWIVLVYSHSEDKIYTVGVADEELDEGLMSGLLMRMGDASTLEFYSAMASPDILSVQANEELIELELKIGYMDGTFRTYRLFVQKGEDTFNIIRHVSEAEPDYGGGN